MSDIDHEFDTVSGTSEVAVLRSRRAGSIFTGVCSGIAEFIRIDANVIRLCTVVGSFYSGWVLPIYLVLAFVLPTDEHVGPGEQPPWFDGQALIKELKQGIRAMLHACIEGDQTAFRRVWDQQVMNCRRACADVFNR
jgi:phage shock protein PspC (stress-responsive transcriptional regulator)